jgi:hypothetical protein
LEEYVE